MGENTGRIIFVNSHDYVSDVDGTQVVGCMVTLKTDDGEDVILYTNSLRLQHTLEMAYATKGKVTVDYFDTEAEVSEQGRLVSTATRTGAAPSFSGPFRLKAIWTLE